MDILNAIVTLLNFVVIPAAAYGAQLALGALGVTLIYGILRFSNFAHGDTMAIGTAFVILVTWGLQAIGISLWPLPTALLALPVTLLLGLAGVALLIDARGQNATLGSALLEMAQAWLLFYTLYRILAPGGVGELHFRWAPARTSYLRQQVRRLGMVVMA